MSVMIDHASIRLPGISRLGVLDFEQGNLDDGTNAHDDRDGDDDHGTQDG